ncbi:MAG TPA: signal peptide peptidase SppA [Gemmatimonas sp.]|nr:signal peptide peptidase SppA [Gemmatimonas sp.]
MKQFFTALAANLVTIALCVVGGIVLIAGIAASLSSARPATVRDGSVLVVELGRALSDAPADNERRSAFETALLSRGQDAIPLRSAIVALGKAADDDRISGVLIRGSIDASGYLSGYAALREFRDALTAFHAKSKKPVHAYLVNPGTKDYYVASAASTVTLDPFGSLFLPGMSAEQVFFAGLFEKYGIGVQVSRVGKFKAAVEPFTRTGMSPENREQTRSYLGNMWSEVKRGIAASRGVDTVSLQTIVDAQGIILPADAKTARLVDRVAYFDEVLTDLERIAGVRTTPADSSASDKSEREETANAILGRPRLPQVSLEEYAPIVSNAARGGSPGQAIAIVYAEGDIVDGQGAAGSIGGDGLARELRRVRTDSKIKAMVLRVNSPGGSAIASETIRRELALISRVKPVVVSMGTVAASGGYWISTASSRVFAEPNTITGSIGVFSLVPNFQSLAARNGVTFDSVKTGRFADIYTVTRPRTAEELAVLQRGVDAIYDAFIDRVATARKLSTDSVRAIAEGRVWSGTEALRIGLVDSLGGLDAALRSAAGLAKITGDYDVREFPRSRSATQVLTEMFESRPEPVAGIRSQDQSRGARSLGDAAAELLHGNDPARGFARDLIRELSVLVSYTDTRGVYARMPFLLRVN